MWNLIKYFVLREQGHSHHIHVSKNRKNIILRRDTLICAIYTIKILVRTKMLIKLIVLEYALFTTGYLRKNQQPIYSKEQTNVPPVELNLASDLPPQEMNEYWMKKYYYCLTNKNASTVVEQE